MTDIGVTDASRQACVAAMAIMDDRADSELLCEGDGGADGAPAGRDGVDLAVRLLCVVAAMTA